LIGRQTRRQSESEDNAITPQFQAATIRALYGAVLTGGLVAITTYQTTGRGRDAILAGGASFVGYMITRGAAEGFIDSSRQANGRVTPADVGRSG